MHTNSVPPHATSIDKGDVVEHEPMPANLPMILTVEQTAEKFTFISDLARRPAAAAAALKRYQDHHAQKGWGNHKPDKLERMSTCALLPHPACAGRRTRGASHRLQVLPAHVQRHALLPVRRDLRAQRGGQGRIQLERRADACAPVSETGRARRRTAARRRRARGSVG
eukprot:4190857-Pleurochrysis_carterae.AAC.2